MLPKDKKHTTTGAAHAAGDVQTRLVAEEVAAEQEPRTARLETAARPAAEAAPTVRRLWKKYLAVLAVSVAAGLFGLNQVTALPADEPFYGHMEPPAPKDRGRIELILKLRLARDRFMHSNQGTYSDLSDLAFWCHALGRDAEAEEYLKEALSHHSDLMAWDDEKRALLRQIYTHERKFKEAERFVDSNIAAASAWGQDRAFFYEQAAFIYQNLGQEEKAEKMRRCAQSCRLLPEGVTADSGYDPARQTAASMLSAGCDCVALGKYEEGKRFFNLSLQCSRNPEREPAPLRARMMLAVVNTLMHNDETAKIDFETGLIASEQLKQSRLDDGGTNETFFRYYGIFLRRQGKIAEAQHYDDLARSLQEAFFKP